MKNYRQRAHIVNTILAVLILLVGLVFFARPRNEGVFSNSGFMPHGHCYLWEPALVWTMVSTDLLIGLAYLSISICLYVLVRRISLPFSGMFLAFGVFIGACGATHFVKIYNLWVSNYWLAAYLNVMTALASVATAILLVPLLPKAVAFANTARLSEERRVQLEAANQQLIIQRQALIELNRELEAFSYSVSHDLRAPLRGIDGFGQALLEDYGPTLHPEAKNYVNFIREGTQKMGRIIDDILQLARLSRTEMAEENVDLSKLAQETLADLKNSEPDRKIEIKIEEGVTGVGDPGLLKVVFTNLFSNAWKFTEKVVNPKIVFGVNDSAEGPVYFVQDNGAGFDPVYMGKLFGVFQRLHGPNEFKGNGIGLATVKRVIHRHGGRIWAESKVDQGATFFFTLGQKRTLHGL